MIDFDVFTEDDFFEFFFFGGVIAFACVLVKGISNYFPNRFFYHLPIATIGEKCSDLFW